MRFLRRSLVGVFLLSMTLVLFAWAAHTVWSAVQARMGEEDRPRPQRERVFAANVVTIEPGMITPRLIAFGEVRSRRTLDLRSSVGGTVVEVGENFENGGRVARGDLLLRIDPVDAEAALGRTQADLSDAQAELRDAERGLALARDELAAAEAQSRLRVQALDRQTDLAGRGVGTAAAVEAAELAVSSAEQAVLSRRQALATAEARIDSANTRLARARIDLAEAERTVAETELRAAFDGVLSGVSVVPGGRVQAGEQLAQLLDPERLEVAFRLPTAQYARLLDANGQLIHAPVEVTLDVAGLDLAAQGRISRESAAVGEGQTGRLLFASLEESRGFRPGDFVTLSADEPELRDVVRLPGAAVGSDGMVLVLGADDRLEAAPVEVLRRQGDDVILRAEGLAGQEIVAERSPLLGAGIKVRPLRPEGAGPAEAPEVPAMVSLTPERRARLVAFVEGNSRMPAEAKERVLSQLQADEVPAQVVERIEGRMGG